MKLYVILVLMVVSNVFGLRADISGPNDVPDGVVNLYDLAVLAEEWLMSLGDEIVVNGGFDTDTDWDKLFLVTILDGKANVTGLFTLTQSSTLETGHRYQVTYTIEDYVSGICFFVLGGTVSSEGGSSSGTFTEIVTCGAYSEISFGGTEDSSYKIDNISVREVVGGIMSPDLIYQLYED